jgi:hypothetical protein
VNRQVNLTKRIETPNGLRYCPVAIAANGRIKPEYVLANGKKERHSEGCYKMSRMRLGLGAEYGPR